MSSFPFDVSTKYRRRIHVDLRWCARWAGNTESFRYTFNNYKSAHRRFIKGNTVKQALFHAPFEDDRHLGLNDWEISLVDQTDSRRRESFWSSGKVSDPGHFLKSQGKLFLSFLRTLFFIFLRPKKLQIETLKSFLGRSLFHYYHFFIYTLFKPFFLVKKKQLFITTIIFWVYF